MAVGRRRKELEELLNRGGRWDPKKQPERKAGVGPRGALKASRGQGLLLRIKGRRRIGSQPVMPGGLPWHWGSIQTASL
jgi:hypothetical protein